MRKARLLSIPLLSLALLALSMVWQNLPADDDDIHPSASSQAPHSLPAKTGTDNVDGQLRFAILKLSAGRQRLGGLKTKALAAASMRVESLAYGRVLDIRPLLELRSRYRSAQSELAIALAALRVARKNHDRLETLHRESIIATRDLIQAESQLAADQARQEAASRHIREVREEALQSWGGILSGLAVEAESRLFQSLLDRSLVLVLIALPAKQSLHGVDHAITIAPSGEQGKSRPARLLAPAPKTEESTQGETWFFEANSTGLRTGMRLDAWIPQSDIASQGVLIPLSAIVWHEGRPWVFVKSGSDGFVRRPVGVHREQGENWFVAEGFATGEEAVVGGGQMLLSEEQRQNAPKSDDD
ncbi:MAG: hypothetical protein NTX45_19025 [Proteobacteria bacterium]|nr:hypothetical protein [Pseudomonadota bacterium]